MRFGSHGNHDLQQLSLSFLYTGLNDSNDHTMVINNHDDFQTGRTELPLALGMPSFQKSAVFLNIVQKAFDPPPPFI